MSNVQTILGREQFLLQVVASPLPAVLKCGADWCGPCRAAHPLLRKLAAECDGIVNVFELDVDKPENAETLKQYPADEGIPQFLFMVNGEVVDIMIGLWQDEQEGAELATGISSWVSRCLAKIGAQAPDRSPKEDAFVERCRALESVKQAAMAPVIETYRQATEQYEQARERVRATATADLESGEITLLDWSRQMYEAGREYERVTAQPWEALEAAATPIHAEFEKGIEDAVAEFLGVAGDTTDGAHSDAEQAGAACALGDPACKA